MKFVCFIISLFSVLFVSAQHNHTQVDANQSKQGFTSQQLFKQVFADSSFTGKFIQMSTLRVPAGFKDPVVHIHDCHLIGYVLEGTIETKMKDKPTQTFKKGELFYEYPKEVHEYLGNPDPVNDALILLYFLANNNAVLYQKVE